MLNVNDNKEEFYSRFFDQLSQSQSWPGIYFFKFIVKSESDNLNKLKSIFSAKKAFFFEKKSSKNKFTSLSYSPLILINIVCNSKDFTNLQYIYST